MDGACAAAPERGPASTRSAHPRAPVHAAGGVGGREHGRARGQACAQAGLRDSHLLLLHRAQQRLRPSSHSPRSAQCGRVRARATQAAWCTAPMACLAFMQGKALTCTRADLTLHMTCSTRLHEAGTPMQMPMFCSTVSRTSFRPDTITQSCYRVASPATTRPVKHIGPDPGPMRHAPRRHHMHCSWSPPPTPAWGPRRPRAPGAPRTFCRTRRCSRRRGRPAPARRPPARGRRSARRAPPPP